MYGHLPEAQIHSLSVQSKSNGRDVLADARLGGQTLPMRRSANSSAPPGSIPVRGLRWDCASDRTLKLQIPESPMWPHFVKWVKVHAHADGPHAVFHGPRCIGRDDANGKQ